MDELVVVAANLNHKWRTEMTFGETLKTLRSKADKSRYRLAQYSGLDEAYILRLESGARQNPSRDSVMKLCLALAANSEDVSINDVNTLILAAGYAPLRTRGEPEHVG